MSDDEKNPLSLENVLTVSFFEYVENQGRKPQDYTLVGVNASMTGVGSALRILAARAPKGTVAIVGLRHGILRTSDTSCYSAEYASGTALIPKPQP